MLEATEKVVQRELFQNELVLFLCFFNTILIKIADISVKNCML